MTLPAQAWTIDANGVKGTLNIGTLGSDDGFGNQWFTGTLVYGKAWNISGFWREAGQEIHFQMNEDAAYAGFQVYDGVLTYTSAFQVFEEIFTWTLAGTYRTHSMTSASAQPASLNTNLWSAQTTTSQIIIEAKT